SCCATVGIGLVFQRNGPERIRPRFSRHGRSGREPAESAGGLDPEKQVRFRPSRSSSSARRDAEASKTAGEAMSQPREHDFADELAALIAKYADVPRGNRCAYLSMAIFAFLAAEKGSKPTEEECIAVLAMLLAKAKADGMVQASPP